jgi:hypothetical protein
VKKRLTRLITALALSTAALTAAAGTDTLTPATADTGWGAPDTTNDTGWGTPPTEPEPDPSGPGTVTTNDTGWG